MKHLYLLVYGGDGSHILDCGEFLNHSNHPKYNVVYKEIFRNVPAWFVPFFLSCIIIFNIVFAQIDYELTV